MSSRGSFQSDQDEEQLEGHVEFKFMKEQIQDALNDLQNPFKIKFQSLLDQEQDEAMQLNLSEAFDSVSDLEEQFRKILDMSSHILNKNKEIDQQSNELSLRNTFLETQNNAISTSQKHNTKDMKIQLRSTMSEKEELLQQVEDLKDELSSKNFKLEELVEELGNKKHEVQSFAKLTSSSGVHRLVEESEEMKKTNIELKQKNIKIRELELTLQENATQRQDLLAKVDGLTNECIQNVTLTEKYQSRMNRYIKKEEMATKALAEVSRTLNQLNEYNNELVTENERLKLEDKRKMESTAFRDSQYMNDTRKSLYTSQQESFYVAARRSTIKQRVNDLSMSMKKICEIDLYNLQPNHLAALTDWIDHRVEYDVVRKRRKSYQQMNSRETCKQLMLIENSKNILNISKPNAIKGNQQSESSKLRNKVIAQVSKESWKKMDLQGNERDKTQSNLKKSVDLIFEEIQRADPDLAKKCNIKKTQKRLKKALNQNLGFRFNSQKFENLIKDQLEDFYNEYGDSAQVELLHDKLRSKYNKRSNSVNRQTIFQQKEEEVEVVQLRKRKPVRHNIQVAESQAFDQDQYNNSQVMFTNDNGRNESQTFNNSKLVQESYVSNALGNDIGDFGDFFVDQNQMRFQIGADGQVEQQNQSYVSNSGILQRAPSQVIRDDDIFEDQASQGNGSMRETFGLDLKGSNIDYKNESEVGSIKENFFQSNDRAQFLQSTDLAQKFCDDMPEAKVSDHKQHSRVSERNERSEESSGIKIVSSQDHFNISKVDSLQQQQMNDSMQKVNEIDKIRQSSEKKAQDLTFANSPHGHDSFQDKNPSFNISTLKGSPDKMVNPTFEHNSSSPNMAFHVEGNSQKEQLRQKRPEFSLQIDDVQEHNPFSHGQQRQVNDSHVSGNFGATNEANFRSMRVSSRVDDAFDVQAQEGAQSKYVSLNEKEWKEQTRPYTEKPVKGTTAGNLTPRNRIINLEEFDDNDSEGLNSEIAALPKKSNKSKVEMKNYLRDSRTVVGSSDYHTNQYTASVHGGPQYRQSVMLTNHTAMTASRMPVIRKDPNEEFFKMTLLAYKLNNSKSATLLKVSPQEMFVEVKNTGIPFNKWAEWIESYLSKSIQQRKANRIKFRELYKKKLIDTFGTDQTIQNQFLHPSKKKLIQQK